MSWLLMSESEQAANVTKRAGTLLFVIGLAVALIAAANGHWHLFGFTVFAAMIGLAFRVEGAVREEVAKHAPGGSESRLRPSGAAPEIK